MSVARPNAAPARPLDLAEFHRLFDAVRNWGRWGEDDDRGTLNFIDPEARAAALRLATGDATIGLAHTLSARPSSTNHFPIVHGTMPDEDLRLPDGSTIGHHIEFLGMRIHGQAITHLDALCHFSLNGQTYNGRRVAESAMPERGTISTMRDGVVGRGVLLDVPRALGVDWLEPGQSVTPEIADHTERQQGTRVASGDIVLIRTGRKAREATLGPWKTMLELAGCDVRLAPWLREREAAILGCDGVSDTYPSPVPGLRTPMHILTLVAMGMPLIDNVAVEDVAVACASRSRWEFLFAMGPLDYPGGSSSPVDPIAIF